MNRHETGNRREKIFSLVFRIIGNFSVLYTRKSNLDTSASSLLVFDVLDFFFFIWLSCLYVLRKRKNTDCPLGSWLFFVFVVTIQKKNSFGDILFSDRCHFFASSIC